MFDDENRARASWMFLAAAEESLLHQTSRIMLGTFFTRQFELISLKKKNVIHHLLDELDMRVYDSSALKSMVLNYTII